MTTHLEALLVAVDNMHRLAPNSLFTTTCVSIAAEIVETEAIPATTTLEEIEKHTRLMKLGDELADVAEAAVIDLIEERKNRK